MAAGKKSPQLMVVSDLDHTMVDHHDPESTSLLRFNALWQAFYHHTSLLVYSTGRSPTLYRELRSQKPMLTPDIAIMSVGTEIMYGDTMRPDMDWEKELDEGWDRAVVLKEASKFPQLQLQAETEQRTHKISFCVDKAQAIAVIENLQKKFQDCGLNVKLIYSGGQDLDILPQGAGKGQALAYLLRKFKSEGRTPNNTLVCGDSGNDAELFSVADVYGVLVENAQEELLHWYEKNAKTNPRIIHASQKCAAGIIEAMKHFGFEPNESPRDAPKLLCNELLFRDEVSTVGQMVVEYYIFLERWEKGQVERSNENLSLLTSAMAPGIFLVSPKGVEVAVESALANLESSYGVHKGILHHIWLDRIRPVKLGEGIWAVKFDRWSRTGHTVTCCLVTSILQSKSDAPYGLCWTHMHETWLHGYSG